MPFQFLIKAGGLIFQHDYGVPKVEVEKTFSYPLDLVLQEQNKKINVVFGERDAVKVGHTLLAVNGAPLVNGRHLEDGRDVLELLQLEDSFPLNLTFGKSKINTNEKIFLASMFHSLYAIASQLSPEPKSSGIELLETDTFRLHCFQTLTGIKFIVVTDLQQSGVDALLKRLYEIYADFALKNPFYSLEMPIRCELFNVNLKLALEQAEKSGVNNI